MAGAWNIIIDGGGVPGVHLDIALRQRLQAAVMVAVAVGEEYSVQMRNAAAAQQLKQRGAGALPAGIDQIGFALRLQQQAVRLADVQRDQPRARAFIRCGAARAQGQQGQNQQKNQCSAHRQPQPM